MAYLAEKKLWYNCQQLNINIRNIQLLKQYDQE